ncbi:MAG: hypothetical protein R6X34_05020 [Chloroflexota bacterium]|jgi:hypothetical protein
MKTLLKIGLALGAAFFIFMVGLSMGFAGGMFAGSRSSDRFDRVRADRIVNERIFIEENVARLVEEAVVEAVEDPLRGEFAFELEGGPVIVERHGRFGPDITVIPPVPPVPDIPEIPAVPPIPAAPIIVHHGGFSFFSFIGSLIRTFFAITFILVGVWFLMRRQPVEKSPKT